MTMAPKRLPQFANEAEEAKWLYEHRSELAKDMIAESRSGRLGEGSRGRANKRPRALRKDAAVAEKARTA